MVFEQFVDDDLGCASYLVGDETAGVAVVDPAFAVEQYVEEARRLGTRIVATLETHTHADHVSGHGRLALEHGVPVHVHPAAEPEFPFEPLRDGQQLALGDARIRVIHTPGHTPGSQCFLVDGRLLAGDTLFLEGCGRTDLPGGDSEAMYESLTQRLARVPDDVVLYPGHLYSADPSATMGETRSRNYVFRPRSVEEWRNLFGP